MYEDLYCARGQCENDMKAVKCDLHSDRTSATTFLANAVRLLLACAAYGLHHALRTHTLAHTGLATAQPGTVILTLCKVATQIKPPFRTTSIYLRNFGHSVDSRLWRNPLCDNSTAVNSQSGTRWLWGRNPKPPDAPRTRVRS